MTTDATMSKGGQQAMLASQRAKNEEQGSSHSEDTPREANRPSVYFPLGYKEAVQQWVRRRLPPPTHLFAAR